MSYVLKGLFYFCDIQAVVKVWDLGLGLPLAPIILGITTAIRGGLIRDVLAGRQTLSVKT